jgi:hypothetical protein
MSVLSTLYDSFTHSLDESLSGDLFDTSRCQSSLSTIQKVTMDVALTTLFLSGCALALIGAGYLEHKIVTFLTFGHLTTLRASFIVIFSSFLVSAAKALVLATAGLGVLWTAEAALKAGFDLADSRV